MSDLCFLGDPELAIDLERRDIVHFDWILDSQLFKLPNHPETLPNFFEEDLERPIRSAFISTPVSDFSAC